MHIYICTIAWCIFILHLPTQSYKVLKRKKKKKERNLTYKCYRQRYARFTKSEEMSLANTEINTASYQVSCPSVHKNNIAIMTLLVSVAVKSFPAISHAHINTHRVSLGGITPLEGGKLRQQPTNEVLKSPEFKLLLLKGGAREELRSA